MSDRYLRLRQALVLALALGLSVSCGDDNGTGPGGQAGGPVGDFSALLEGVVGKYFENNEPAFTSLGNFAPFIGGVLSIAPGAAGAVTGASLQQGCIDPAVFGTTFEYDFSQNQYFPGQMSGAPTDGVRFLLYEGQQANGHVDVRCPGDLPTINVTIAIEWADVVVYSTTTSGSINLTNLAWMVNSTGTLRDPQTNDVLNLEMSGSGIGTQVVSTGFIFDDFGNDFGVQFGRTEDSGVAVGAFALKGLSQQTFEWSLSLAYTGSSLQSLAGYVDLASLEGGSGLVACLSGSYESLTVSEATGCADDLGFPVYPGVTSAHRSALRAGYDVMREMLGTLTGILQTGVEVAISSVG